MSIVIDARMINASGVGTYLQNLLPRVIGARPDKRFLLVGKSSELAAFPWARGAGVSVADCAAAIYSPAEQYRLPRLLPRDTELFWAPHFNIPLLYRGRLLVTVHDAFHLALPQYLGGPHKRLYARALFGAVRHKAAAILTVSNFSKAELLRLTGRGKGQVHVVHLGVDASWFELEASRNPHPRPFLLFVGNVKPHKNLAGLLEAFAQVAATLPHDLVIVGRREGFVTADSAVATRAQALGARVRFTGYLSADSLRQHVIHARALILPSFYEGFGLPPLEAMACGTPVIVSRAASLPEVCGDGALYCDPHAPADIAAKIRTLLTDGALREALRARGRKRAGQFSWDRCARETLTVLEGVLA
jgi:glycosyltransferase involved in cell wall biosynthesis